MRYRIRRVSIIFLVLLSVYILIFNIIVISSHSEINGWLYNSSRRTSDYILPEETTTLIEPHNMCRSSDPIFLLIVVTSSANNVEARQSIRETWGSKEFNYPMFEKIHGKYSERFLNISSKDWRKYVENLSNFTSREPLNVSNIRVEVVFLLGLTNDKQQIQTNHEHEVYGDIIQENFIDSYNNLTLKTVFMLKWVTQNCFNKVRYIMKTDDDLFLNVPNLIHILLGGTVPVYKSTISFYDKLSVDALDERNRLVDTEDLLLGFKHCSAKPVTDVKSKWIIKQNDNDLLILSSIGKWYNPSYMFDGEYYPEYISGSAYVMTYILALRLYEESLKTPLFHLEDVFLTGIVAKKINIKRIHHPLFRYYPDSDICSLKGRIVKHLVNPTAMILAYNFVTNLTNDCAVPDKNFSSVKFNLAQLRHSINCIDSENFHRSDHHTTLTL